MHIDAYSHYTTCTGAVIRAAPVPHGGMRSQFLSSPNEKS
jgi:hypothetical protein